VFLRGLRPSFIDVSSSYLKAVASVSAPSTKGEPK